MAFRVIRSTALFPSRSVVQVLVLLLFECCLGCFGCITLDPHRDLAEKLPIHVIFRFGKGDALRRDELLCIDRTITQGHLHRGDERAADATYDESSRGLLRGI